MCVRACMCVVVPDGVWYLVCPCCCVVFELILSRILMAATAGAPDNGEFDSVLDVRLSRLSTRSKVLAKDYQVRYSCDEYTILSLHDSYQQVCSLLMLVCTIPVVLEVIPLN